MNVIKKNSSPITLSLYEQWFSMGKLVTDTLRKTSFVTTASLLGMVLLEPATLAKVAWKTLVVYRNRAEAYGFNIWAKQQGDKAPVLLLHGAAGSWNYMGDLAAGLRKEGFPVFVLSLGGVEVTREKCEAVQAAVAKIQSLYQRKVDLVAHSLGGVLALASASSPCIGKIVTLALPYDAKEVALLEEIGKRDAAYNIIATYDLIVGQKLCALPSDRRYEVKTTHVEIVYEKETERVLLDFLAR